MTKNKSARFSDGEQSLYVSCGSGKNGVANGKCICHTRVMNVLDKMIESVGGQAKLARLIDPSGQLKRQNVRYWQKTMRRVPVEWVLRIESATGVSRHALRPDIYPRERGKK